jgi:2'-hydroxyisoflavone reductase
MIQMHTLLLGGTVFLGRHIVKAALARGHVITLFNRGRQNPDLFPEVEKLRGDRDGDLAALHGRRFDTVIDTSGFRPEQVRATAELMNGVASHYTFISTISVYREFPPGEAFDETAPVAEGNDGYGPLKARCEEVLEDTLSARVAHVRPGLIVGPHDPTDRFTYWPRRIARGGDVLAPGRPNRSVQFIDVRDLAEWCVRLAEQRRAGVYNAVGPASAVTMREVLDHCQAVAGDDTKFVWIADERLVSEGVEPWTELPLWIPERDSRFGGMLLGDNRRALTAGLTFRPIVETIQATLEWDRAEENRMGTPTRITSIAPEREAELLARYR